MFSKELLQYISSADKAANNDKKRYEGNSVTKPLLYIILKCNAAPKSA